MSRSDALGRDAAEVLREAADWYYTAACLYEDEDLDPDDHDEVIRRAFASSDCDDFAAALALVTGWPTVRMTWPTPDGFGHHSLVRAPDGRLLDVGGWTDEAALTRRYGARGATFHEADPMPQTLGQVVWDGVDESLARIVGILRALPRAPFDEPWFREMSSRPVEGADVPMPSEPGP